MPVFQWIQGIVFSSEYLKYDQTAIGLWTRHTRRNWIWRELRFSTVVYTPVLDIQALYNYLLRTFFQPGYDKTKETKSWITSSRLLPSSTWLSLVRQLDLEVVLATSPHELVLSAIDTLPADFAIVPAFGSVEAITILAIIAGCNIFMIRDGYPFLRGRNMQLEFRPHSTRGIVAVFSVFTKD